MHIRHYGGLVLTSLLVAACGAGTNEHPTGEDASATDAGEQLKPAHEFVSYGTNYAIVETTAGDFLLTAQVPPNVRQLPHLALVEQYGNLTVLEILLALAPDQEPDQRLVDYHFTEAALWGREDLSIQEVVLDAEAFKQKSLTDKAWSTTTCEHLSGLFVTTYPQGTLISTTSTLINNKKTFRTAYMTNSNAVAICNSTGYTIESVFLYRYQGDSGVGWLPWVDLPPDGWRVVYGGPVSVPRWHEAIVYTGATSRNTLAASAISSPSN